MISERYFNGSISNPPTSNLYICRRYFGNFPSSGNFQGKLKIETPLHKITSLTITMTLISDLDLSEATELEKIICQANRSITSVDFLSQLPHPEKLTELSLVGCNFAPTDLNFLKPFINLTNLRLGETT